MFAFDEYKIGCMTFLTTATTQYVSDADDEIFAQTFIVTSYHPNVKLLGEYRKFED